ncbi:MAG: SRPBCC family protein [Vitreimonas sp.]
MQRSVSHATFVIERAYKAPPSKVFAAFASTEAKAQWFGNAEELARTGQKSNFQSDFRVGGKESISGTFHGSAVTHAYDATFWDIVENERIVIGYQMHLDQTRISVSVGTTEIKPDGAGSTLIYTEQGAFLDGYDDAGARERGTQGLFDQLERHLAR